MAFKKSFLFVSLILAAIVSVRPSFAMYEEDAETRGHSLSKILNTAYKGLFSGAAFIDEADAPITPPSLTVQQREEDGDSAIGSLLQYYDYDIINQHFPLCTVSKLCAGGGIIVHGLMSYAEEPSFKAALLPFFAYSLIAYSLGEPYYSSYFIDPMVKTWHCLRCHNYISSTAALGSLLHYYDYEIINQPFLLCAVPILFMLNYPD